MATFSNNLYTKPKKFVKPNQKLSFPV